MSTLKGKEKEHQLDCLELTFRETYLGRSEMWRLKSALVGTGVRIGKTVEFCKGAVRLNVHQGSHSVSPSSINILNVYTAETRYKVAICPRENDLICGFT